MAPQDSFIDDEDDTCPLCVEEFDLSDRNFRPCPCGYQICQFCFNNIKQNMNGLCPACRRPYDEKSIQWKVVTQEEIAEFRSNIQKNQKKRAAEQRQKEVQKREAEKENRKNLVGVRVVQKNLVYVIGLNPTVHEDELLKTLRKQEFFGQYGNIQKISISNRKSPDGSPSLGIYVTFEKKEEAQRCIQAVNGSVNGDRTLKAQLGTTKYCSAWLRHEPCTNRQCMFLHELGDEEDSYTRQDLSSMNSINTQRPLNSASRSASRQQSHPVPAASVSGAAASGGASGATSGAASGAASAAASVAAASSQPMARSVSKDDSENGDASALPSSANWARNPQVRSRRGSHATSGAAPSPAISMSLPVTAESAAEAIEDTPAEEAAASAASRTQQQQQQQRSKASSPAAKKEKKKAREVDPMVAVFARLVAAMENCTLPPTFLTDGLSLDDFPPLFDPRGGEKRRALREDEESRADADQEEQQQQQQAAAEARESSEGDGEPESSGSLALGGEPEDREQTRSAHAFDQQRGGPPPPIQRANTESLFNSFGASYLPNAANPGTIGNRSMTPQQTLYARSPNSFVDHPPPGIAGISGISGLSGLSGISGISGMAGLSGLSGITASQSSLFQGQAQSRQPSRYGFAGESVASSAAAAALKLAASNPRVLAQQTAMMPPALHSQQQQQQQNTPYYAASMPGPPPGLKSTGTPPAMFGHGGYTTSGFGASGAPKDTSQLLQDIIRGNRGGTGGVGGQAHDAGKREYMFPSFLGQFPSSSSGSSTPVPTASGFPASLYGAPPPPPAFPDLGPKQQKKRGKRHRHANTSSSGGSGLVDLADPTSLLQARLPHQQSNAGVGQGLFGGQATQDDDLPGLDEAASNVEALVSDEPGTPAYPYSIDSPLRSGTPSFPPGFGPMQSAHPTPPPGFGRPMTPASVVAAGRLTPVRQLASTMASAGPVVPVVPVVPAIPVVPAVPALSVVPSAISSPVSIHATAAAAETPTRKTTATPRAVSGNSEAGDVSRKVGKADKALASNETAATASASVPAPAPLPAPPAPSTLTPAPAPAPATPVKSGRKGMLQDEDFPALDASMFKASTAATSSQQPSGPPKVLAVSKPSTPVGGKKAAAAPPTAAATTPSSGTPTKKADKKKSAPSVLNATAPAPAPAGASSEPVTADLESAFPSLPTPAATAAAAVAAAAAALNARPAPKTLRVVQTTKTTEQSGPSGGVSAVGGGGGDNALSAKASNRPVAQVTQAVAAIAATAAATNRPETPASEIISDNASVVSASISASRAGSPPPSATPASRIGSAAVRATTKSQQRKQRKQATKMDVATIASQPVVEQQEEEVIGPILGRKKKQKKEKPAAVAAAVAAAGESREATASPSAVEVPEAAAVAAPSTAVKDVQKQKSQDAKKDAKQASQAPTPAPATASTADAANKKDSKAGDAKGKGASNATSSRAAAGGSASTAASAAAARKATATAEIMAAATAAAEAVAGVEKEALDLGLDLTDFKAVQEAAKRGEISAQMLKDAETIREYAGMAATVALMPNTPEAEAAAEFPKMRPCPTIHETVQGMVARGMLSETEDVSLLRPFLGLGAKVMTPGRAARTKPIVGDALLPPEVIFSEEDRMDLMTGKVVRKEIDGVRLLVTPNGDCLRDLSDAEQARFLELQARVAAMASSPLSYLHPRHETRGGFALIGKRAVPCGMPGYFPPSPETQQVDPVTKIQREEAVYWINQYVLPRLNLLPASEAASWQSMLADTGMPQAIGTSTVAPWIYHTPDVAGGGSSGTRVNGVSGVAGGSSASKGVATSSGGGNSGGAYGDASRYGLDSFDDYEYAAPHQCTCPHHHSHSHSHGHGHAGHGHLPQQNGHGSGSGSGSIGTSTGISTGAGVRPIDVAQTELENSVRAMSVEDAEMSLQQARQDVMRVEKALWQAMEKNQQLVLGRAGPRGRTALGASVSV